MDYFVGNSNKEFTVGFLFKYTKFTFRGLSIDVLQFVRDVIKTIIDK